MPPSLLLLPGLIVLAFMGATVPPSIALPRRRGRRAARTAVLLSLALVAGASTGASLAAQSPSVASDDRWETIDSFVERERREARIPGIALGIVKGDSVVHVRGFGVADPSGRAVTPRTRFHLGSVTKSMTAVAVLQLAERGALELDAPVRRYLPWFTLADPEAAGRITVRHLLTHTSGMSRATGLDVATSREDLGDGALERQARAWTSAEVATPPGTAFQYNNANYLILGVLVETLGGLLFESYLRQQIFAPLDMRGAGLSPEEDPDRMATGYRYWFGVPRAADIEYGRVINPAGGVIASVEDLTGYLVAQLNGGRYRDARILSAEGVAALHRPASEVPEGYRPRGFDRAAYGLGWFVGTRDGAPALAHPGDLPTFHSDVLLLPEEETGIVLLMNSNHRLDGERMRGIADGVARLATGGQPAPPDGGVNVPLLVFRVVLGLALAQLAVIAGSIRALRRWATETARRPVGPRAVVRHVLMPLGFHLLLALLFLRALPGLMNLPLSLLVESTPDLGWIAIASGGLALGWGIARSLLAWRLVRG